MAGNKNSGRSTRGQELALIEWYKQVLPQAFGIAEEMLKSKSKADRLWAMEWLKTGIVKMIPQVQKIGGDENNQTPIAIYGNLSVSGHNSNTANIPAVKAD